MYVLKSVKICHEQEEKYATNGNQFFAWIQHMNV